MFLVERFYRNIGNKLNRVHTYEIVQYDKAVEKIGKLLEEINVNVLGRQIVILLFTSNTGAKSSEWNRYF